ncbi:MAG: hypothetical protein ACXVYB_00990 [Arthrobacter sp.]
MRRINQAVRGILAVSLYPPSLKSAWIMTAGWAAALLMAVFGVVLNLGGLASIALWWNLAIAVLDIYMLQLCIRGIHYRRNLRPRRRA